jgi:L-ascorbate metabolism protein UlaG (beta-lactamase superfamily)
MQITWLGWAGFEIEVEGGAVVVDPLADAAGVFAALGDAARNGALPDVVAPKEPGRALAGLVSHLHRDHADARALRAALAEGASVFEPVRPAGGDLENLGVAQAIAETAAAGLRSEEVRDWQRVDVGPFGLTALPAVDGLGDPQVSWLIEADGKRILHLGDTVFHGYWWRMRLRHGPFDVVLAPVNGALVQLPHRQPASSLPAAMDPEQAALAGKLLGAQIVIPMHYDGFTIDPWYLPVEDAATRFLNAAAGHDYEARTLQVGETLELAPDPA